MKHHWADFLDREDGHWTMVPNRERYAHELSGVPSDESKVRILTLGKKDTDWLRVLGFPSLEEVTLHEPSPEQVAGVCEIQTLRRLRISHLSARDIEPLGNARNLEEVVLE